MTAVNHHCCVIEIKGLGILIEGPSGSGKTSLLLTLFEHCTQSSVPFSFVSDDQANLSVCGSQLLATAPGTIKGKIEIRGYGIVKHTAIESTKIDLLVRLVPDEKLERMPARKSDTLMGMEFPVLEVPQRHESAARRIVMAWIAERT